MQCVIGDDFNSTDRELDACILLHSREARCTLLGFHPLNKYYWNWSLVLQWETLLGCMVLTKARSYWLRHRADYVQFSLNKELLNGDAAKRKVATNVVILKLHLAKYNLKVFFINPNKESQSINTYSHSIMPTSSSWL